MEKTGDTSELITGREGGTAWAELNRPAALNALTYNMIAGLAAALDGWEVDDSIKDVHITGAGDRAFCAGGDIKASYAAGTSGRADEMVPYFAAEYGLNRRLFHFKKPITALMDGITMGGGFGVAGPCKTRIATARTVFAMPETGIGLFPDVGSMYFLSRCPGQTGAYLAVTGNSIGPEDCLYAGLATEYEGGDSGCVLRQNRDVIDRCFAFDAVEEILTALGQEASDWARQTKTIIESRSPVSLKVSLAHLRKARGQSFDEVTARDFTLVQRFLKGHDFYEGVRAAVIDKDKNPRWNPARLEDVNMEIVEGYFAKTGRVLDDFTA